MKKKLFLSVLCLAIALVFSFSYTLAANDTDDNPIEGIRDFVGGAENVMEDAANGVAGGVKNMTRNAENTMDNATNHKVTENNTNSRVTGTTNNNSNYTATRTSDTIGFAGVNNTTWMWIIVALSAIGIISLIWTYVKEKNYTSDDDN